MFETNDYFDGKVKSIAFQDAGQPATIGVMAPGEYQFGTGEKEKMTVVSGALTVQLPGSEAWQTFRAGDSFHVPGDSSFGVKVTDETSYLCRYG